MRKAVIYARSANDNEESISRQIELCNQFASQNGYKVIGVFADNNYSGMNMDRPNFNKMNELKSWKTVIVVDYYRLTRNINHFCDYANKLRKSQRDIVAVNVVEV